MDEDEEIELDPPSGYNCTNCSAQFNSTTGAVNEIHIYSATNEFEKSISILDAITEVFASTKLQLAQSSKYNILMCSKCAETVSYLYKYYLNFICLSSVTSYMSKMISQIESLHQEQAADKDEGIPVVFDLGFMDDDDDGSIHEPHVEIVTVDNGEIIFSNDSNADCASTVSSKIKFTSTKKKMKAPQKVERSAVMIKNREGLQIKKRNRHSSGVVKHRYFKCHYPSCDHIERYNFKIHEHLLTVHEQKTKTICSCGFTYHPEIYITETHRCYKKSKVSKSKPKTGSLLCEVCGMTFNGRKVYWQHLETVHVSDSVKFTCQRSECGRKFKGRRQMLFHSDLHQHTRMFLCNECGRTFNLRTTLTKHLQVHRIPLDERIRINRARIDRTKGPLGHYECEICHRVYSRRLYLAEHMKYKHDTEKWKLRCPICGKPVWSQTRLNRHLRSHDPKRVRVPRNKNDKIDKIVQTPQKRKKRPIEKTKWKFDCGTCGKRFKYRAFLIMHERSEHPWKSNLENSIEDEEMDDQPVISLQTYSLVEEMISPECNTKEEKIKEEVGIHDPLDTDQPPLGFPFVNQFEKEWACDQCDKTFTTHKALAVHYLLHTGETQPLTFTCLFTECGEVFKRKFQLTDHLRTKHPIEDVQVLPEEELKKLKLNVEAIATKRRFKCEICSNMYTDRRYLNRHILSHSGAHNKIPCPFCDYKTSTRTLLKSHVRANHGDKIPEEEKNRFTCEICNKSFAAKRGLNDHIMIHTGEIFRFLCPVSPCKEKFRCKTSQDSHVMSVHPETLTQEQLDRWKCVDCDKKFTNRKNMVEHRRMHLGIHLRHSCPVCGYKVRHPSALKSHMKSKHANVKSDDEPTPETSGMVKSRKRSKPKKKKFDEAETSKKLKKKIKRTRKTKAMSDEEDMKINSISNSSSIMKDVEISTELGIFWRCDICHRSFNKRRLTKVEHMQKRHPSISTSKQSSKKEKLKKPIFITPDIIPSSEDSDSDAEPYLSTVEGYGIVKIEQDKKLVVKMERIVTVEKF